MAEFGFSAKINADVSGFQKGMQKAEKSINKFAKGIEGIGKKGIVGSLANVTLAVGGVVSAFKTATKVIKDVAKAVGECTEAYKTQAMAERALQTAIENNPYITGESMSALKKFASEMQKVTNYGDEQIIQLETQLVSLGRTEEETMKIIKVATDMASSGTVSLDTAITQLNATLNGNIGRLGQQNAELKDLTEEELKSGKAIDILGEKFKGLAQATIDTSTQLKNIKGDFKEAIGEFTLPSSDMWNKFWIGFYERGIAVINQFNEYLDKSIIGKGIAEELIKGYKSINDARERTLYLEDNIHALTESQITALSKHLESIKNRNAEQEELLRKVNMEKEARVYLAKIYAEMDAEEAQRQKNEQATIDAENDIAILKGKYLEKVAEQERKWKNIETVTGEVVSNEEKIKFYQDGLVDIMTQANGQITTNNQLYKDQIKIIQQLQSELQAPEEEKKTSDVWVERIRQQAIERLQAEKESYEQTVNLEETTALERYLVRKDYNEKILALQKEQLMAEREKALQSVEGTANEYEEKARIIEYYNYEIEKLNKGFVLSLEKEGKDAGKAFAEGFKTVVSSAKDMSKKVIKVFSAMSKTIKNIFSKGKSIFSKLFDFNIDDSLDSLLVFEDKVLTFFVETLPKLPKFVASVIQSLKVLLKNIFASGGFKALGDIFSQIFDLVMDGIDWLFNQLATQTPQIINLIGQMITRIVQILPSLFANGLPAIAQLLGGIIQALASAIASLTSDDFAQIVEGVIKAVATLGVALVKAIPDILKGLWNLAKGLVKGLWNLLLEALKATWKGLKWVLNLVVDWFKNTFGGYATGTNNAQKGYALVGEQGPELIKFNGGEKVYNNKDTQTMLKGSTGASQGNTFNVTFNNTQDTTAYAMMQQLRSYNRQMAINGVI